MVIMHFIVVEKLINPYKTEWTTFDTELELIVIIHELSHAVKHVVLDKNGGGGHDKDFVEIFYKMADEYLIRVFDGTLESYMFNDFDYYNTEKGIEIISKNVEQSSEMEKKNLTIAKLKKKLGLKILR